MNSDAANIESPTGTIRYLWMHYRLRKNPIYAWMALKEARRHDLPVPAFVFEYLDRCAEELLDLVFNVELRSDHVGKISKTALNPDRPSGKQLDALIARALGLKRDGRGSVFAEFCDTDWIDVGRWVEEEEANHGKMEAAYASAARAFNISEATARSYFERYLDFSLHDFITLDYPPE